MTRYGPLRKISGGNQSSILFALILRRSSHRHSTRIRRHSLFCNPPYVRHHHISGDDKLRLKAEARRHGFSLSGLSGLYVYFLLLSHQWLAPGAISVWLIPTEFLDVNYGRVVRDYLLSKVELISIHRFNSEDVQFAGALVSSAVIIFRNSTPTPQHESIFTEGGTLLKPTTEDAILTNAQLKNLSKWSVSRATKGIVDGGQLRIGDIFSIKRGIATGGNEFFVLSEDKVRQHNIPREFLRPILPSARNLKIDEVFSNDLGEPTLIEHLYLLDCQLSESEIKRSHPSLWEYLEKGKKGSVHQGYLCRSREAMVLAGAEGASSVYLHIHKSSQEWSPFSIYSQSFSSNRS